MKKQWIFVLLCTLGTAMPGCASTPDDDHDGKEQAVKMEQLPPAVRATLTKEAGNGKIEEIDMLSRAGKTEYEADVIMDGKKWEITIGEDGKLLKKHLDEEKDNEDEKDDDKNGKEDD